MSENYSRGEETVEQADVVELGIASKETRGSPALQGLFDGGTVWPLLFYRP